MKRLFFQPAAVAQPISLDVCADQARAALACDYSSSAEFDAALIAQRRAAGVYGPKRQRRQMLAAAAGVACGLAVLVFIIALID